MSIINEALKKAQRQRSGESGYTIPAEGAATPASEVRIPKHPQAMPTRTLVVLIGGGASLLVIVGAVVFVFLLNNSEPEAAPRPKPLVAAKPPTSPIPIPVLETKAASTPADSPTPVSSIAVVPSAPSAPESGALSVSVKLPPTPPSTDHADLATGGVTDTPEAASSQPETARPVVHKIYPNPSVYEFLEKLRVAGVRASSTDPKVIINDRLYRLNDIVDKNTQLRLVHIESLTLIFSDSSGFEYRKNL